MGLGLRGIVNQQYALAACLLSACVEFCMDANVHLQQTTPAAATVECDGMLTQTARMPASFSLAK